MERAGQRETSGTAKLCDLQTDVLFRPFDISTICVSLFLSNYFESD